MAFFTGCGIVLKQQARYILIQEVRHEKAGFYNLPAGTLEVNEDFVQCITREAKEETGVNVTLEHFIGVYQTVIGTGSNVVFLVFAGSTPEAANFHSEEHEIIKAFTYEEIVALDKAGKLRSPIVRKAIEDYQDGQKLPLSMVQSWHVATLTSLTVEKGHY